MDNLPDSVWNEKVTLGDVRLALETHTDPRMLRGWLRRKAREALLARPSTREGDQDIVPGPTWRQDPWLEEPTE